MNYKNKDYYDYILKIDKENSPLHGVCQKVINLLIKEGLDKPISKSAIDAFFRIMEYRRYTLKESGFSELYNLLEKQSGYQRAIKEDDGTYYIYPELDALPAGNDLLLYYSLGMKKDIDEINSYLYRLVETKASELKSSKMAIYYGDTKYLILRTKAIFDAITMLNKRPDIKDKFLISQSLTELEKYLNEMLNIINLDNNPEVFTNLDRFDFKISINKQQYDLIRKLYIEILKKEDGLVKISNDLWNAYAEKNSGVFIHQLTASAVKSDEMDKICTSFYSDNANVITGYDGTIGYAYPMNIKDAFSVAGTDAGSWRTTKNEFIERGLPSRWQLDETNLWYECAYHSKLFTPEYIEERVIEEDSFAEIVINNRDKKIKPLYCFYTAQASNEKIAEITALAKEQELEIKLLKLSQDNKKKDEHALFSK